MQLIILAAGLGSRLSPLSHYRPKPLLNYQGQTLLSYHLEKAAAAEFENVLINTAHGSILHHYIAALKPKIPVTIVDEPYLKPLNTGYGITHMLPYIHSKWICVISADIYSDWTYSEWPSFQPSVAHLILTPSVYPDFGLKNGHLCPGGPLSYANIGIFQTELFHSLEPGTKLGDIIRLHLPHISAQIKTGNWANVGDFKTYCY